MPRSLLSPQCTYCSAEAPCSEGCSTVIPVPSRHIELNRNEVCQWGWKRSNRRLISSRVHLERQVHCTCPQSASVNLSTPAVWIRAEDLSCAAFLFSAIPKSLTDTPVLQVTPFFERVRESGYNGGFIIRSSYVFLIRLTYWCWVRL